MDHSSLSSIAGLGTRYAFSEDQDPMWVWSSPTEQQIIMFDTKARRATRYARTRPDRDSEWHAWRVMEEKDLQ